MGFVAECILPRRKMSWFLLLSALLGWVEWVRDGCEGVWFQSCGFVVGVLEPWEQLYSVFTCAVHVFSRLAGGGKCASLFVGRRLGSSVEVFGQRCATRVNSGSRRHYHASFLSYSVHYHSFAYFRDIFPAGSSFSFRVINVSVGLFRRIFKWLVYFRYRLGKVCLFPSKIWKRGQCVLLALDLMVVVPDQGAQYQHLPYPLRWDKLVSPRIKETKFPKSCAILTNFRDKSGGSSLVALTMLMALWSFCWKGIMF
ncbi:hypothetical protein DFJ43DRAFT_175735 [Lentinula guzmanii]|uniref:Uncharacterized protein n=1 Tax=Lentinula guzmanii TaxID=2804957 RepID=A0AA38N1K8_9AGAR|nr:hypothetical protein DFJ43DRAFT_175735 [Lentinula guzmanii]